jgi:CheY-like chemotaxis protein
MSTACSPCQIILAEDNPADVGLVRHALREHQVECNLHVIDDGEEVLSFISKVDLDAKIPCPDLLLLDLHLPKRDGREILKHLRASERCWRTPVVVLTSSDSPADRRDAETSAAIHYFRKPCSLEEFMQLGFIVRTVINRSDGD